MTASLGVAWRFGRPHTLIGTTLSVVGLYAILLADRSTIPAMGHLTPLGLTWISAIAANFFIVGLNQLTDVEIDRINKPDLPIPAGALSARAGNAIVVSAALAALLAAALVDRVLVVTVGVSMVIGTAYSLPPLRLKRFAGWAAASIAVVRGLLVNVGVYAALAHAMFASHGEASLVPAQVWALAAFMAAFGVAIAVAKDVPDVAGDRWFAVDSLAVRLGPGVAFGRARWVLSFAYVALIALALLGLPGVDPLVVTVGHLILLAVLWSGTLRVDPEDGRSVARAYGLLWWLFYAEYVVYPAACVMA